MKLIGLAGLLVFLCFELLECQWKLRQFVVHIGNFLIYLFQLFSETVSLGLQVSFGLLHLFFGLGQGDNLSASHFRKILPVIPLFDHLLLTEPIRKSLLGPENWNLTALDICSRVQCFLKRFLEATFQGFQDNTNQLSISNKLANSLVQELQNFLKFGLCVL